MAIVREYQPKAGARRFTARYPGADGKYDEERAFASRREAKKAVAKREVDATRGDWASPAASRITFSFYVDDSYWPTTAHLEVSTRAGYRYYLDKHFLPRFGDLPMRRIGAATDPALGERRVDGRPGAILRGEVPRAAAQDLRSCSDRPGRRD
jgi:hypothetical protein